MSLDDRYSAWLDGELGAEEVAFLEAELAADAGLAAEFESLRAVRALVRAEAMVALPDAARDRIVAAVAATDAAPAPTASAEMIALPARRRLPTVAAVAASFAIIVSVVGGLGGRSTLPAVGDLIARHDAAAAAMPDEPMDPMDDMPAMPGAMEMAGTDVDGDLVHAVYTSGEGRVVSVFRQDGDLDVDGLVDEMDGGETGEMDGKVMWSKDIGDRHITVLDGEGYVWTIVTEIDEPMDPMMDDMMDDLPSREVGTRERLHDVAEAIVEPFGLGV